MIRSKQLVPHSPDCYAIANTANGHWGTPWSYLDTVERRDSIGRRAKHGSRWWRVRCNCTDCPSVVVVDENAILECVPVGRTGLRQGTGDV